MWTHVFTIVPTKSYHHSNLCSTKTFSIIQCKIKETPLAMNEASWYMYTSHSILSTGCRLPTQPFCPEAVLLHLSNNRTGQIVSACLLSRHQLNPWSSYTPLLLLLSQDLLKWNRFYWMVVFKYFYLSQINSFKAHILRYIQSLLCLFLLKQYSFLYISPQRRLDAHH